MKGQEYYLSPQHNSEVRQFLGARYIAGWSTYEFTFGFASVAARNRLGLLHDDIRAIDSNALISDQVNFLTVFRSGDAVGETNCLIPSVSPDRDDESLFQILNEQVMQKYLDAVRTPDQVYKILMDNQKPFRWGVNPVIRASEAIAIGLDLGVDADELRQRLHSYGVSLVQPYRSIDYWRRIVNQLFSLFDRDPPGTG